MAQQYNTFDSSFKSGLGNPSDPGKYEWTGANPHNLDPGQVDWSNLGAQNAAHKRQMIGNYMTTGQLPGGGNVQDISMPGGGQPAGGGGAAGGGGGAGTPAGSSLPRLSRKRGPAAARAGSRRSN